MQIFFAGQQLSKLQPTRKPRSTELSPFLFPDIEQADAVLAVCDQWPAPLTTRAPRCACAGYCMLPPSSVTLQAPQKPFRVRRILADSSKDGSTEAGVCRCRAGQTNLPCRGSVCLTSMLTQYSILSDGNWCLNNSRAAQSRVAPGS